MNLHHPAKRKSEAIIPQELRTELEEPGFESISILGVEGPGWLVANFDSWWQNPELQAQILQIARTLESEPCLLGIRAHLVAAGQKPCH